MESLLKNLEKHVTCSICLDFFTEPKTIECLHTFCFECLKTHALTTQQQGIFRCPECQAKIGVPQGFDKLPTGFLQNSLLDLLAVQKGGEGSEISCGNCRKRSADTSFCFECGKFMCPDCVNAHELLRNVAFEGHKVRPIKHFKVEDYEGLLKRQSFCSQQYHEREITRFYCVDCECCVCHTCVITDHKNHAIDPLDKAADGEKAKLAAAVESMKEKSKLCSDVIRQFEQIAVDLETNTNTAKRQVSQTADQMIAKIRELEREAIVELDETRASRLEQLNEAKNQLPSLLRQINQAIDFASNLVQRSSSSDIMQGKDTLEKRFNNLDKSEVPTLTVGSYVKFVSASEAEKLTLGIIATHELTIKGLTQDFQAGVEAEFVICPNLTCEVGELLQLEVLIEPTEQVGSLITHKNEDKTFSARFVPKVPGAYNISVAVKEDKLHKNPFSIQVKERRLEVVGEDLKGQTFHYPFGTAVNSKGLIAVSDYKIHCILMFDKEGKYLRKFGRKGEEAGQLNAPAGLTFVDDDNILVAEELNHRIQKFNVQTGNAVKSFGSKGSREGEFENPLNVCIDDEGRVAVGDFCNNRIQVFTKDGEFSFRISEPAIYPAGCIFHDNMFIVSDSFNHCLKIFDRTGKFLRKIGEKGNGDGQLNFPQGLCTEKCGNHRNILVCDYLNNRIVQFSVEGFFTGKSACKLTGPCNIATTPDGRVLVTDSKAKTVFILK